MSYTTLISPEALAPRLEDPDLRVLDCRFQLADPEAGERAWRQGHVPGAGYAHLERDLSGPATAATGRHPLPEMGDFAATLSRWGVGEGIQVVAYDDAAGMFAARLWWMLRCWVGHQAVAVLDGGLAAWQAAGGRLDSGIPAPRPGTFRIGQPLDMVVTTADLERDLAAGACLLVDARTAERFGGSTEPVDPVAGHVPGAVNHPCQDNLGPDGRFLPAAELAARWRRTLGGRAPAEAVCMCGSGVTACHDLLALEHAGLRGARLYAGSWSEWIRDPGRPVVR